MAGSTNRSMPITTQNQSSANDLYSGLSHLLRRRFIWFFVVFQVVVMYDTIRNKPVGESITALRTKSSDGRIYREVQEKKERQQKQQEQEHDANDDGYVVKPLTMLKPDMYKYSYSDDVENDEEYKSTNDKNKIVYWLDETAISRDKSDYYSGSWYMPMDRFRALRVKPMQTLEDASHAAFHENRKDVRMSVDWLDFAVEHMSRWIKKLDLINDKHNDVAFKRITDNQIDYIKATPEKTKELISGTKPKEGSKLDVVPVLHPTIAIISFKAAFSDDASSVEASRAGKLTATGLGATIASLMRAGFGRIVCTTVDDQDIIALNDTFVLLQEEFASRAVDGETWIATTELGYVQIDEGLYKTAMKAENRPRGSLYGLQQAFEGKFDSTYTKQWLGSVHDPSYWKYVYFTEPDLLLQTRPVSLPAIHSALERDRVLMPHRLESITHEYDMTNRNGVVYDGTRDFLPAEGAFEDVLTLDTEVDMCCDNGIERPDWNKADDPTKYACASWWWDCGYTRQWQEAGIAEEIKHRRLLYYSPLIRLTRGINLVSIPGTEHERKCRPQKRQKPNDICKRPSSSGRSFATSEVQSKEQE